MTYVIGRRAKLEAPRTFWLVSEVEVARIPFCLDIADGPVLQGLIHHVNASVVIDRQNREFRRKNFFDTREVS